MANRAESIVNEIERVTPYMYEGLYGNFLRHFMESDKSKWTRDLSIYLSNANQDWSDVGSEVVLRANPDYSLRRMPVSAGSWPQNQGKSTLALVTMTLPLVDTSLSKSTASS